MPNDTVEYRLPALTVRVRSEHPDVFDYLDSFHDRGDAQGTTLDVHVAAESEADDDAHIVTCDLRIDPPEFTFQEARHRIRELWHEHLTATGTAFNLHAAAVDDGETVTVFVGERCRGKTTLLLDTLNKLPCDHLTNDNLVVYQSDEGTFLTTVATYLKVRSGPATRFASLLASRAAASRHGAAMWQRYLRDPAAFPFHTEAMLPPAGFGSSRQPIVRLDERRVVLVEPEFVQNRPSVSAHHNKRSLVAQHLKWRAGEEDLIDTFVTNVEAVHLQHTGRVDTLLRDPVMM